MDGNRVYQADARYATYRCTFDSCYFGSMFGSFSMRARQVVFVARCKTGERGAAAIGVDDFINALILEDQGMLESIFSKMHEVQGVLVNGGQSHVPFFSSKVAQDLLSNLEKNLSQSPPVPLTAEIPLSPSLVCAFDSAKGFQTRFQHNQIEPLHLLAAILTEESSEAVKLLHGSGITQEKVLLVLGAGREG